VSTLTTAGTIANTGPPPTCTMRIANSNGDDISQAEIGDELMLQVRQKVSGVFGGGGRVVTHQFPDQPIYLPIYQGMRYKQM
jgi:hypothetical protein